MMAFFQKVPNLIPIDLDNVASNDWIILLEANTIVDSSGELRVARTTQERKIVWRFRSFRRRPFLVIDGYDPRIHTLYFCPQLYKHDEHGRLVPLEGEEIGRLLAKALEGKVKLRLPWYDPSHKLPADPIIAGDLNKEFDTLVIDEAPDRPRLVASIEINNWRWAGVPFYLRTGKHLSQRNTEITICFKQAPYAAFQDTPVHKLRPQTPWPGDGSRRAYAPGRAKWIARVHAVQAGSLELQPTARHSALHIFSH